MRCKVEALLFVMAIGVLGLVQQGLASCTITYQGKLEQVGQPLSGTVDMMFELTGPHSAGSLILELEDVFVTGGLFQVELDFGDVPYEGGAYLKITVEGEELSPFQTITAAPLAVRSLDGGSLDAYG